MLLYLALIVVVFHQMGRAQRPRPAPLPRTPGAGTPLRGAHTGRAGPSATAPALGALAALGLLAFAKDVRSDPWLKAHPKPGPAPSPGPISQSQPQALHEHLALLPVEVVGGAAHVPAVSAPELPALPEVSE